MSYEGLSSETAAFYQNLKNLAAQQPSDYPLTSLTTGHLTEIEPGQVTLASAARAENHLQHLVQTGYVQLAEPIVIAETPLPRYSLVN